MDARALLTLLQGPATPFVLVLLLVGVVLLERVTLPSRALAPLKALFPSWRFFEDVGPSPRLFHRHVPPDVRDLDAWDGPWVDSLPPVPRRLAHVCLNPHGNLRFTCGSVLDQLVAEIAELPDAALATFDAVADLVPYRLLERLVVERLRADGADAAELGFQLRIVLDETGEEILRSPRRTHRRPDA